LGAGLASGASYLVVRVQFQRAHSSRSRSATQPQMPSLPLWLRTLTCARPHRKAEDWAMWTRIGAAVTLFSGLISVMIQLVLLQASPTIAVAFADCIVGAMGIFASSYMTRRAATIYLVATLARLVVPIAFYSAFFAIFVPNPKTYLSDLLCGQVALLETELTLSPAEYAEAQRLCNNSAVAVIVVISLFFTFSVTLCWYPCCRCSLYLRETLVEKEALEGLLNADDEVDAVEASLVRTPAKVYASNADHDASVTVVSPPMGL